MANEISITVGANETASDVIVGVGKAAQRTERVIVQSMGSTEEAFDTAARGSSKLGEALDSTAGFAGQMADGIDGVGQAATAVSDLMSHSARKAEDLARAQIDVEQAASDAAQAIEDMNQANRDSAQAGIDAEQAHIDQKQALIDETTAQNDYNAAVKEFGAGSTEAQQAMNDMNQAKLDGKQATEDLAQSQRDAQQAIIDGKQALIDQKSATQDLTASQRELESQSSILTKISDWAGMLGGVLSGLVGIIGAVTAVQWLWNIAMTANPIGLIIVGIGALIAVIVLIATKTTWFQTLWKAIWSKIGDPVKAVWQFIKTVTVANINLIVSLIKNIPKIAKSAFSALANFFIAPFKAAFRSIAWLWNNTIGRLSFSIPSWVPGIGGASFSAPKIPQLAAGGDVLKSGLAMIHQGEKILPKAQAQRLPSGNAVSQAEAIQEVLVRLLIEFDSAVTDSKIMAIIIDGLQAYVKARGGNVQVALGRGRV